MSLPAIDWRELSVQVMMTFAHFLWQGCVVGIILCVAQYVGESLRDSQLRRGRLSAVRNVSLGEADLRLSAVRNVSLGETDLHGASIRYAIACIAFFSLPIGVIATFAWVHQSRGPFVLVSGDPNGSQEVIADNALARVSDTVIPARSLPATLMKGEITASETSDSSNPAVPLRMSPSQLIQAFAPSLLLVYMVGAGFLLLRFLLSILGSSRLRRTIQPITDIELLRTIAEQCGRVGLKRVPLVALCQRVSVPVVVGIVKPMILLPPALLCGLDPNQVAAILCHEMAHIRRYDLILNLLQRVVEALLFFHPVTWWISRRLSIERENCCDDIAAGCTGRLSYAGALLQMAELCIGHDRQRAEALATLSANGRNSTDLGHRIRRLLGAEETTRVGFTRRGFSTGLALFSLLTVSLLTASLAARGQSQQGEDKQGDDKREGDGANAGIEPWEISRLYDPDFLSNYLLEHEVLPKPIIVPSLSGKVFAPDGSPVAGVSIVSYTPRHWVDLDSTLALNPHNSGEVRKSKQDGTFVLPERTEPYRVLLVHETGVANVSHEELLRADGKVTLQKWASISGTLRLGGVPQAGEIIRLDFDTVSWSYTRLGPRFTTTHQATTDQNGNFSFDRVPPLGGMARSLRGPAAVYQCESGKHTHIEMSAMNAESATGSDHHHDHHHDIVRQQGPQSNHAQLPRLIVKTVNSEGKPVPNTGVMFYDRNSHRAGRKQEFEREYRRTDASGVADFGVMPNRFGCLQLSPPNKELAECYTLVSATMTQCTQADPPRANVRTEIKDGILTVTFVMTPHVDLEFNIVDDVTNEIVFWSEIFYQDPTTNRWWQFGLVDGSQLQHNFIPISPQITRETIRISALGYETKVFRLPDELDRSQPIRRDVRLKPMPDVELRVLLPDETPAENAKLTFHYPNELDCLQDDERLSDARGIVTTEFPPNADIGIFRLEHTGGTAELSMKELLDDVQQNPGNIIHRSIMLRKSEKPTGWISARPQKITVATGSAIILDDNSVRLAGTATSQEVTAHFTFEELKTIDELRLELLPVYAPSGREIGRGGDELILFDVKAGVQQPAGEWTTHEFSGCISLLNPDDATTVNCIDYLSDTGWTVPVLPADREAHELVLRFDEPVTLQPGEQLVLTVDSGGSLKFAALNRIRFAFHLTDL